MGPASSTALVGPPRSRDMGGHAGVRSRCLSAPPSVAHSLGCAWCALGRNYSAPVQSAFLVAPADVDSVDRTPDAVRSLRAYAYENTALPQHAGGKHKRSVRRIERSRGFARAWGVTS